MQVASIVVFTSELRRCVAFYRTLGVPLDDEDHGDGHVHAAGELGGIHLAVFPGDGSTAAPGYGRTGSTFVGFWVPSLEAAAADLAALGSTTISGHTHREWGCRIIVADPDGRAVEINQRGHCDGRPTD